MKSIYFIFIVTFSMLFYSCKKDKDESKPAISITSPVYLQQVNGLDTVQITGIISDDRNIERVKVSLKDGNNISILSSITKHPNTSTYNLNLLYYFNDIHLPSAQYDFSISASDGENTTTEYVTIILNEEVRTREGVFLVSNTGTNSDIYYLDNSFNGNFYQSIAGDFIGTVVNSYDQQLIHASTTTGSLTSVDLFSGASLWSFPIPTSSPTIYYSGFSYDNGTIYTGKPNSGNGIVQGFDKNGAVNFNSSSNGQFYTESILVHENNYVVTEQHDLSSSQVNLVLYWISGPFFQQASINEDIKGIFSQSTNSIVLFTNNGGAGNVIFYDITTGLTSNSFNPSLGVIDDCTEISSGIYLVAEAGNITLVNVNNFTTLPYLTGTGATKIWYDNVTNELFLANGSNLTIYDYSSKNLKGNYTHTNIIEEVAFWYNK